MKIISIITLSLLFSACLRLDSNMFNPVELEVYELQHYTEGDLWDVMTPATDIADSLIHLMTLESDDNGNKATIYAVYVGDMSQIATDTVILYCHGNSAHIDKYWNRVELLANAGGKNRYGVMMLDYRGYGMSEGSSVESSLYADVNAAMLWLKNMGLSGERLVVYGFSLGSAPATELTANPTVLTPMKLILEAPFASVHKMQQDATQLSMPQSYFADIKLDNAEEIKKIQQPFLWIHGEEDAFLRIEHGELVSTNYQGVHKVERRVPGGEHSTVPKAMDINVYIKLIGDFISGVI